MTANVDAVQVSVALTVNGAPMAADGRRGKIVLTPKKVPRNAPVSLAKPEGAVPRTGAASATLSVLPNTYTITFVPYVPNPRLAGPQDPRASLPSSAVTVAEDVDIYEDQELSFDLETVAIKGEVTLDGKPIEKYVSEGRSGIVVFQSLETDAREHVRIHPDRSTYETLLWKRPAAVAFHPSGTGSARKELPTVAYLAEANFDPQEDAQLDISMETVDVTEQLTMNGEQLSDTEERPRLRFRAPHLVRLIPTENFERASVTDWHDLPKRGPAYFGERLYAGQSYEVWISQSWLLANLLSKDPDNTNAMRNQTLIQTGLSFEEDKATDIDIDLVDVSGTITLNGAPFPTGPGQQEAAAKLLFIAHGVRDIRQATYVMAPIGADAQAGRYRATLPAGTYDVMLRRNWSWDDNPLPPMERTIAQNLSIDERKTFDFDVETVTVSGRVSLGDLPTPAGTLSFSAVDELDGLDYNSVPHGWGRAEVKVPKQDQEYAYEVELYAGNYDVVFSSNMGGFLVHQDVPLADDRSGLDVEFPVCLCGEVLLEGEQVPGDSSTPERNPLANGQIKVIQPDGVVVKTLQLGRAGPARFEALLPAGSYRFLFEPSSILIRAIL